MAEASEAMKAMARRIAEHQVPDQSFSTHSLTLAMRSIAEAAALAALNARQSGEGEREALREALAEAYRKGATDVHNYWVNNPGEPPRGDPEFGESASDYAAGALVIFDSAAALRATDDAGEV